MAIKTEMITIGNKQFTRTYSDEGYMLERDGIRYEEAVDPLESASRTYTETDERIEGWSDEATLEDYQNTLREVGVLTDE